jgi:tetratricopeptide (TPR) repeat protein
LAPFEAEHAAVFFGRARVIDEARRRLAGAAEGGSPFLLIVGASGSGKSSLARAGLIPRLTTPGLVASVDLWRVARMKPGEGRAGPLMALATALLTTDALPELAHGDYPSADSLADNLRRGGAASVQPIASALERVAEDARRERHTDQLPKSALVLLVDQFEELFAQGVSDDDRAAFAESLRQLVTTGRVWVVATLRADVYELLLKQPALKALKEMGASLDLGPPGPAELAEIVRAPAAAAGLVFETDAQKGELGERLLADAKNADSLPLLQFTLQQLYERRTESQLTHKAYDALGGLEGAIAAEAERAVSGLKPEAVATLPKLLRRLAEPAHDGTKLTLREISRSEVEPDASEAALLDALITARILIARTDVQGRPTVRLAHDAVFVSWPRAKDAVQANRDFYRVRAEVEDALRLWQKYGRPKDRLIQPGVQLAEAENLVQRFDAELSPELTDYVTASRHRARRRQRFERAAAAFFFALAVGTTGASVLAYLAQKQAFVERDRATQALATIAQTGNTLVNDLGPEFFVRGLPADLLGRMLDRAIQGYDQAIQLDPKNAVVAYVSRGWAYAIKGDYNRAIQDYDQAIQLDPKNAVAYRNRGVAYESKADHDRAIQDFDQAIQLDPKDTAAFVSRGGAYVSKGDHDRAMQDYDQAIQLEPTNAVPYLGRGRAYQNKSDPDRAIEDYNQAIRLNPKFVFAYVGRGDAYESKSDLDRAIQDYNQAIQLDPANPKNVSAYTGRGIAYQNKDEYNRAIQDYDQAIRLDPKNAFAYVSRGDAYRSESNTDRAIQDYDQAILLEPADPKNLNAYVGRGLAYTSKSDPDRAILDFDQAIRLDPKFTLTYVGRGLAYASKSDPDNAIQDFDQAIRLAPADPKNVNAYVGRGLAYASKSDPDNAVQDFDQAIRLAPADPKNVNAYLGRGDFYRSKGDPDRAIKDYDQAIRLAPAAIGLNPKFAPAYIGRGDAYQNKGDPDRAIQDYDRAIKLDPTNGDAYVGRGDAYESKDDPDRAIQDYHQAIQLKLKDDIYSAIWRHLARERAGENGAAELEANEARLKSKDWPYPVIELYLGRRSPAEVLSIASNPDENCDAQFYTGEWHLLHGDRAAAATGLQAAAAICPSDTFEYKGALAELKRLNL